MSAVKKILLGIANFLSACSTVIVVAMMLLIVADVALRAFFNMPIKGSTEITQMLMTGMILGFAKSCLGNDNLKVDVVAERLPRKVQFVLDVITSIICIGISILLAWRTIVNAVYHYEKGLAYLTLASVPKWPFILMLAIGFIGGVFGFILRIMKLTAEEKAASQAAEPVEKDEGGDQ